MPRILLVEDDAATASAVRNILEAGGHDVLTIDDGEAALSAVEGEDFDVIIVDVVMKEASRLVELFHESAPGVPIVAIAGHGFRR